MCDRKVLWVFVLAASLALAANGLSGQPSSGKAPAAEPAKLKPLVRKDLLQKHSARLAAVKRDPFSPQSIVGNMIVPSVMPKAKTAPAEEAPPAEAPPALVLHYIGFSENVTQKKMVAMIFFQEQVTAVEEGDTLGQGYKVVKITAKELQVEGPDGKILTFSLGG